MLLDIRGKRLVFLARQVLQPREHIGLGLRPLGIGRLAADEVHPAVADGAPPAPLLPLVRPAQSPHHLARRDVVGKDARPLRLVRPFPARYEVERSAVAVDGHSVPFPSHERRADPLHDLARPRFELHDVLQVTLHDGPVCANRVRHAALEPPEPPARILVIALGVTYPVEGRRRLMHEHAVHHDGGGDAARSAGRERPTDPYDPQRRLQDRVVAAHRIAGVAIGGTPSAGVRETRPGPHGPA